MTGFPISVHDKFRCAQCQSTIRFGGIVDGAQCPSCGRGYPMTVDAWRVALESAVLDGPDLAPGCRAAIAMRSAIVSAAGATPARPGSAP